MESGGSRLYDHVGTLQSEGPGTCSEEHVAGVGSIKTENLHRVDCIFSPFGVNGNPYGHRTVSIWGCTRKRKATSCKPE